MKESVVNPLLLAVPTHMSFSYSQAAGFVEGTGFVQWIGGLVCWGDLQVTRDVDLEVKLNQHPQDELSLVLQNTTTSEQARTRGVGIASHQVSVISCKLECINHELQCFLPWPWRYEG